jgi:glycine betaine/proline transport system permease protein
MQDELIRLQREMQRTIVFITHDFAEAIKLGDRIAIMKDGVFDQVGTAAELITSPATDYVREFTEDVPKAKVLTAADVMAPGAPLSSGGRQVSTTDSVESLVPALLDGADSLTVVDPVGYCSRCGRPGSGGPSAGVTVTAPPRPEAVDSERRKRSRWFVWLPLVLGTTLLQVAFAASERFPAAWDTLLSDPLDRLARWAQTNRRTHPLFTGIFGPLTDALTWALDAVQGFLEWIPWFVLPAAIGVLVMSRTRDWKRAAIVFAMALYPGVVGLWPETMATLALMTIAVVICVVIGIPLGVWAAFQPQAERAMRPALDAMQTIPAPIYFLPMILFFGIGPVAATFATVIYALPPLIRLTTLGIRQVPAAAVEASEMYGSKPLQTLVKVQLPMALSTIMTGISQSIMMALGIVVLAGLLAAGGLGQVILEALRQRATGRGLAAGFAIVAVAMVLDRAARSIAQTDRTRWMRHRSVLVAFGVLVTAGFVGRLVGIESFPGMFTPALFDPIDSGVVWVRDNMSWLTRPFNDFVVAGIYVPVRDFLTDTVAWPVLVFAAGWLGWVVRGWKLAAFIVISVSLMGLMGWWAESIDTLTQVLAAVLLSLLFALPLGVWAGRSARVEAALGPFLDTMQTMPPFVYMIPVVNWFTVGVVPGVIASVMYAFVPGVRITALGIRQVPTESLEASRTFGATPRQTMWGVRIPLAAPTLMAAINQVIMMVLAMVIIAGLIGGGALGFEVINAVTRGEIGNGFEVGLAIALMAMILDRLTQATGERLQPP